MKKIILFGILTLTVLSVFAQTKGIKVTGCVIEKGTKEPVTQANIQLLLLPDTTFTVGAASDDKGNFTLPEVSAGKYLLKFTFMGYKDKTMPLELTSSKITSSNSTL